MKHLLILSVVALLSAGCPDNPPPPPGSNVDESIFADELGGPMAKATAAQLETFEAGREVALRRFDTDTGLGPHFNVTFCAGCHEQPVVGGSAPRYRDFFLVASILDDGSFIELGVNGVQPQFSTHGAMARVDTDGRVNNVAQRNAIPFFGVGAIAAIDEAAILANVDEDDADGDGISGRPNYDRGFVGRFGRKSQTVSIEGFIRGPIFNHLGVTSNPLSNERKAQLPVPSTVDDVTLRGELTACINCQAAAPDEPIFDDDGVPDPELSEQDLFDLVSFSMLLGAPKPEPLNEQTRRGKQLFQLANCSGCHVESLRGPGGDVPLYSDLLLHDMGEELADHVPMGVATGREFRTQPLWGIVATGPYLHDGRADTIDDAIRWHGGEAERSRDSYLAMSDGERADMIAFLESLGGRTQASDGLIPPDEPIPAAGELGGPSRELTPAEADRFEAGRRVFDRDFNPSDGLGLGRGFNGDSCRACHFDPVVGGAGPAGLNVTRQGIVDPTTLEYSDPVPGTMIHRHTTDRSRPERDLQCNVIEMRNTPSLLGLGLIDLIPEAQIASREDPDDLDGDGISGRTHRLPDGRIGRFGWKAGIPTLEDFYRDALSNELGLTLDDAAQFVAGVAGDDDDVADPEFGGTLYHDLIFYGLLLGPPRPADFGVAENRGSEIFETVGCADCHVPQMTTADGQPVRLYSDLLLHDVAPPDFWGIAEGQATMREFRTPPLWGIGDTAPYMHDGLAPTLDAAIRRHDSEGAASRDAYDALSAAERDDLLKFLEAL